MTTMEEAAGTTTSSDFLSQLPNDVLIYILEKMDLRDAIRAGVLSRRWRRLSSQLPRLVVNYEDFLPADPDAHIYYNNDNDDDDEHGGGGEEEEGRPDDTLWKASDKMLQAAMALLASRGRPACALSVSFLLRHNYRSVVRLLDEAVASGKVRDLELNISTTYWPSDSDDDDDDNYKAAVRASLRYGLPRLRALLDSCPAAFGSGLTRLALEYTRLRDPDDLADVLRACPRLEALSLVCSGCASFNSRRPRRREEDHRRLWSWSVRHARLADVRFTNCNFHGGLSLAWLPRLERFLYRNWDYCGDDDGGDAHRRPALSFGHVPCLQTLTMSNALLPDERPAVLSQILANTGSIADLCLRFTGGDIWVKPEAPKRFKDIFRNLRYLKIHDVHEDWGLTWTMFLLQAAPSLKELRIKIRWDHECEINNYDTPTTKKKNVPWEVDADFKHYSLSQLIILGFYGAAGESIVTYLHSLAQAAVNLQEIHMHDGDNEACQDCGATPAGTGTGMCSPFPRTEKDKDALRQSISSSFSRCDRGSFKIFLYSS